MTTYRQIHGRSVKAVATDPTAEVSEGEIWYNTTSDTFKTILATAAWTSGANMPEANYGAGSCGAQTAFLYFGGSPYPAKTNATREYDGSSWTTTGNFTSSRSYLGGCGTQTAGLGAGGYSPNTTASAEYDGSSWTAGNSMSQQRMNTGSTFVGIQTAALLTGGDQFSSTPRSLSVCEEYDGTNYSSGGAYPVVIQNTAQGGTQTAGWAAGGLSDVTPGTPNTTQSATNEYNGTAWTAGGALPTATIRAGGAGTQTAALFFAGLTTADVATSFEYDGSSWTATPSMATARQSIGAGGVSSPSTAAIGAGGYVSPGTTAATEEFSLSVYSPIAATWASGTNLPSVRWNTSGAGTATAGLVFGGATGPGLPTFLNSTFEYDGSSWTAGGNTPASRINQFSAGIQTAAIGGGGYNTGNHATAYTYDGSTWTTITDTPYATKGAGAGGTSTAALIFGSDITPSDNQDSYSWNGASWAEEGALNNTFSNGASGGPTENTTFAAGSEYSPQPSTRFETYDGSSWTSGPSLNTLVGQNRGFGSSSNCLSIGGFNKITGVEKFDGTSWATTASLATGRKQFAAANFTAPGVSNGWVGGGADGDASVETFTDEVVQLDYKTLTTS